MAKLSTGGFFTTTECAERAVLSKRVGWETDYRQLGKGKYFSRVDYTIHPGIRITRQFGNRETCVRGVPPANHIAVLLPRTSIEKCIFQGRAAATNEALIIYPGSEGLIRSPRDFVMFTACLRFSRLQSSFHALTRRNIGKYIRESGEIKLPAGMTKRLAQICLRLLELNKIMLDPASLQFAVAESEEEIFTILGLGLTHQDHPEPAPIARRNRMKYFSSARDYIEANLNTPLGIETLARETGASSRTLGYVFRDVLNTTPLHYIKARRLIAARQHLLRADQTEATVTEIANDYGFTHLGYFSRDYKSQFGELPSETLRA
jgi:AraC-like DNA-binding protein